MDTDKSNNKRNINLAECIKMIYIYSRYFLGLACQVNKEVNKEIYRSLRTSLPLLSAIRRDVVKGCG